MTLKTVVEALEMSAIENPINRYRNQAFIDLFETIFQIIKEIKNRKHGLSLTSSLTLLSKDLKVNSSAQPKV